MKRVGFLTAVILFCACVGGAQTFKEPAQSVLYNPELAAGMPMPTTPTSWAPSSPPSYAMAMPIAEAPPASEPAAEPQGVEGVFPATNWQVYGGYAFVRFYVVPGTMVNSNGFDAAVAYYHHNSWLGVEGELVAAFGSLTGQNSTFLLGTVGPKVRWTGSRGFELWAHGLVGGGHFSPQTIYGNRGALAYELGGGVDIPARNPRIAFRAEADMVGTRFFGTYQYSPKISAGIVYKF